MFRTIFLRAVWNLVIAILLLFLHFPPSSGLPLYAHFCLLIGTFSINCFFWAGFLGCFWAWSFKIVCSETIRGFWWTHSVSIAHFELELLVVIGLQHCVNYFTFIFPLYSKSNGLLLDACFCCYWTRLVYIASFGTVFLFIFGRN